MCNLVSQPLLIDRPNLFEQNHGVPVKAVRSRINLDMRWKLCLLNLGGNSRHDTRWTEPIADIVLDHQNRPNSALLGTDNGRKIRKKNVTTFYDHCLHPAN